MGHRMEIYLEERYAQSVIEVSKSFGVDAQIIGRVEESEKPELQIKAQNNVYNYTK